MSREEFPIEETDGGTDRRWMHKAFFWFYVLPRVAVATVFAAILLVVSIVIPEMASAFFCALPLTVAMVVVIVLLLYERRYEVV